MLLVLSRDRGDAELAALECAARELGAFLALSLRLPGRCAVFAPGLSAAAVDALSARHAIERSERPATPYPLVGHEWGLTPSVVEVAGVAVGGPEVVLMAGPCAVEGPEQLDACAEGAARAGARLLRGGAFKPRTSPHAFTGLKQRGLELLAEAGQRHGLAVVTEVMDAADVPLVGRYADMLQVGARNMQNFTLLSAVGRQPKPVLLKRGLCATYEEWLLAAEHIRVQGNAQIVLCERGIRTFERATRNTLDVAAVPVLRQMTPLPVVVDPSHGTGRRDAVLAMSRAGIAAGADGLLLECHPQPEAAWSDGPQSLTLAGLTEVAAAVGRVAEAVGRRAPASACPRARAR